MEQARRKLRICLICVVFAAVLAGIAYYYYEDGKIEVVNKGTLVKQVEEHWTEIEEKNGPEMRAAAKRKFCRIN